VEALRARVEGELDSLKAIVERRIPPDDAALSEGIERARAGEAVFGNFDTTQAEADYNAALDRVIAERGIDPERDRKSVV
jgi:hypothetical protein